MSPRLSLPLRTSVRARTRLAASAAVVGATFVGGTQALAQTTPAPTTPPAPGTAPAPAAPPAPKWYDRIAVTGSIDTYYDYNTNSPKGNLNSLQAFNVNSNQFNVPLAELVLAENPDPVNSPFGWHINLGYGTEADAQAASSPSAGDLSYKNLEQAYGTYIFMGKSPAPITVNLGKFWTWIGYEVIPTQGNWNYSRGLVFNYCVPFYHAGVSVNRNFGKLSATGYLVNGWNNVIDNNNGKSVGYGLSYPVSSKLTISTNGLFGPELTGVEGAWRKLSDTIVTYNADAKWSFAANYDYGADRFFTAAGPLGNTHWQGFAGFVHYQATDKVAYAGRAEILGDPSGTQTGTRGTYKEVTGTYEYKFHPRLITRLEARYDWGPGAFNGAAGPLTKSSQLQFIIGNTFLF